MSLLFLWFRNHAYPLEGRTVIKSTRIQRRLHQRWIKWDQSWQTGTLFYENLPNLKRSLTLFLGGRGDVIQETTLLLFSASCTMGAGSFPELKSGRGVTLTPHPLLVSWSRKSRATPLLTLWAVRPVPSLSVCTRVHFTFFCTWPWV